MTGATGRAGRAAVDELGAHVSAAGGTPAAPARAREIGAHVLQIFTKQPNRWAERVVGPEEATAFRAARAEARLTVAAAHDSYLINLATPDPTLFRRSLESFTAEVRRCEALGLDFVVTHPGNATDGDPRRGIQQNAEAVAAALDAVPGRVQVLLEGTAGSGSVLGSTFEELGRMVHLIARYHPDRIGVCLDTCHLWAAGYDLHHLDDVLDRFDRDVGLRRLRFLHLNDSATPFASRKDRHADIGAGSLGEEPFRAIMNHPRLRTVPKVIETPKGDNATAADRANLARLRAYRDHPVPRRKKGPRPRKN